MTLQNNSPRKRVWHDIQRPPVRRKPTAAPLKKTSKINQLFTVVTHASIYLKLQKQFMRIPQKIRIIGAVACVLIIALGIYLIRQSPKIPSDVTSKTITAQTTNTGPNYPTILPEGKTIQDLGGWIRASPLDKNPVFAYADTLTTTSIKVNEQPLPANFKENTGQKIEELLHSYKTNEKIIAGNTDVSIGTAEDGSQSVIFYQNNLLVLITSPTQLQNSQWIDYITSLR